MPPRDPNVQLPKSVRDKVLQGENIFRETYGQPLHQDIPPGPTDEQQTTEQEAGPIRPPVQPEQTSTQNELSEQAPQPPQSPTPPPASWEQRYKTLEGRAKAEATTHRKQLSELTSRIDEQTKALMEGSRVIAGMQDEIRQLRAAPVTPPAPVKPAEIEFELTPEEREQWSPEFLNLVKRAAGAVVAQQIAGKDQEITGLRSQLTLLDKRVNDVDENSAQNSLRTFLTNMTIAMPDWEAQNTDENFLSWLERPDGFSGQNLKNSLDMAVSSRNVAAAVRIFQGYRAELEASNPTPPEQSKTHSTGNGSGRVRLESLAAPRVTRQQPQSEQEAPLPPTPTDIQKFTADVTKGKYKGRDAERVAFERRINELARASIRVATRGNPY